MEREEIERIVRENYPYMSGNEIDRRNGWYPGKARKTAVALGIRHLPETEEAISRIKHSNMRKGRTKEAASNRGRRHRALYRMEYMRMWEGRERRTNLRLRQTTVRAYAVKWNLCKRYGYKPSEEPYTLLVTPDTRRIGTLTADGKRRNMTEQAYTEKYHIKFMEAV